MKTNPWLPALLAMISAVAALAAPPPQVPSPPQQARARPPVLPTPEWLRSKPQKPPLGYYEEIRENAMFSAFDIDSLPADEYELWRVRWREKCDVQENFRIIVASETLTLLVRLRDEELVNWLFSLLEQGQGTSTDAAEILGNSGQEWLIPRLEKTLFLKSEDEPQAEPTPEGSDCVVLFGTVSEASFRALKEIINKSRVITPRVKSWFNLAFEDSNSEGDASARRELLKQWWALNKERMAAGDYRHLQIITLWPGEKGGGEEMDVPYVLQDYLAALHSDQVRIRIVAMETITSRKLATEINLTDLESIAEFMTAQDPHLQTAAYHLLAAAGDHATGIFKKLMEEDPAKVPELFIANALNAHPFHARDRARFIATIVANDSTSYLANHKSMQVEAYPLLKQRVTNSALPENERMSAISRLSNLGLVRDIPYFEGLLNPTLPKRIREGAVYNIFRLLALGNPPASIRALENDQQLGPLIKRQLEELADGRKDKAEHDAEAKAEQADETQLRRNHDDMYVAEKFAGLMASIPPYGRSQLSYELLRSGQRGVGLLKMTLSMSNVEARAYAAMRLMEFREPTKEEGAAYLSALVNGLGSDDSEISNYLRSREDLHSAALPLLKARVLDVNLGFPIRTFAALHIAAWATKEDLPFFESILTKEFPSTVRSTALHAIHRILPPDEVPQSIRALSADPELGEVVKIYRYHENN